MTASPAPRRSEVDEQRAVKQLLTLAGFVLYDTSQGYRKERGGTRMTPGLADLVLFHPRLKRSGFFEVKTIAGAALHNRALLGKGSPKEIARARAQQRFMDLCLEAELVYGFGGIDAAWRMLEVLGLATPEPTSMTGYRLCVARGTLNLHVDAKP